MGLLEIARGASCRRGYEYYKAKAVATAKQESDTVYSGTVRGSNDTVYDVYIDTAHPRKSHCNCPFADGKTIVCKHQIALYFSFFPEKAKQFYEDVIAYEEETEKEEEELYEKVQNCILNMKKSDADCKMKLQYPKKEIHSEDSVVELSCRHYNSKGIIAMDETNYTTGHRKCQHLTSEERHIIEVLSCFLKSHQ